MEPTNPPADIKVQQPPISQTQSEDQPPIKPPEIIKPKKPFRTTLFVILFVVTLAAVLGYFVYQNYLLKKEATNITPTQQSPIPSQSPDPTSNWVVFNSKTLGIEFKIPPQFEKYGVLGETINSAEKGTYLCITFPAKKSSVVKNVIAGGTGCNIGNFGLESNSVGFEAGQMGSFLSIQGFEYKNDIPYVYWGAGTQYEKQFEIPSTIVTKISENIIKIKGGTYSDLQIWPMESQIGAIIKTKNTTYPGLVLEATLNKDLSEKEFDQILSTFKFLEQNQKSEKEVVLSAAESYLDAIISQNKQGLMSYLTIEAAERYKNTLLPTGFKTH